MSRITDYYRFVRLPETTSKGRLDCVVSTGEYPPFEESRGRKNIKRKEGRSPSVAGGLWVYYGDTPDNYKGGSRRRASKSITMVGNNLSGIYEYDMTHGIAYGDVRNTSDAILFLFHNFETVNGVPKDGAVIEIFISRGRANSALGFCQLYESGELDDEIDIIRRISTTEESMNQMAPDIDFKSWNV